LGLLRKRGSWPRCASILEVTAPYEPSPSAAVSKTPRKVLGRRAATFGNAAAGPFRPAHSRAPCATGSWSQCIRQIERRLSVNSQLRLRQLSTPQVADCGMTFPVGRVRLMRPPGPFVPFSNRRNRHSKLWNLSRFWTVNNLGIRGNILS
jgi:hypothetical protein